MKICIIVILLAIILGLVTMVIYLGYIVTLLWNYLKQNGLDPKNARKIVL
jgi:hypothetical protein